MAKDPREYGFEGEMAMSQLKGIIQHAEELHDMLEPDTDLPEWVQSKITLAYDYMQTATDYMSTEMTEEVQATKTEDRIHKVMHKGKHVANIRTYRGRAGGYVSQAEHPDGSSAREKYGIGLMDTKREMLSKIKKHHSTKSEEAPANVTAGVAKFDPLMGQKKKKVLKRFKDM